MEASKSYLEGVFPGVRDKTGTVITRGRRSRRLALAILFAVLVFISKIFLPTPSIAPFFELSPITLKFL